MTPPCSRIRRRVAFITDLDPLMDILVHNQDIGRPLGINHPMPPDAAAAAADWVLSTPRPIRRWKPPQKVRLIATDVDWATGVARRFVGRWSRICSRSQVGTR